MTFVTRYLPTNEFHIVPVRGLTPEELKQSAKDCLRDRERLPHNTLLNLLAKSLGARCGFAGYRELYTDSIRPFMEEHNLIHHVDLLKCPVKPGDGVVRLQLSVEQVSGRLFDSGLPLPHKLFTGYNFPYTKHYQDGLGTFNDWLRRIAMRSPQLDSVAFSHVEELVSSSPNSIEQTSGKRLKDLVLGGFLDFSIFPSFNLLGDLLVQPTLNQLAVPKIYWPIDYDQSRKLSDQKRDTTAAMWFRETIESSHEGWVEVIPFNEKLIFLKGEDGRYDFLLPKLQSSPFEHQIYAPYLKRADIPSQMNEEYHFQRWYYFQFDGWREKAKHESENEFYEGGGTTADYPGTWPILRSSLLRRKSYIPSKTKLGKSKSCPVDFHRVQLDDKCLYVSDLISISEFARFTNHCPAYLQSRNLLKSSFSPDELSPMNQDAPELPVSVSWYDACAFMAYFEERYDLPARLLKTREYLAIRQQCSGASAPGAASGLKSELLRATEGDLSQEDVILDSSSGKDQDNLLTFIDEANRSDLGAHPNYMPEERFQSLVCKFAKVPEYIIHPEGLMFVDSNDFGEWLYENPYGKNAAAVRSKSLRSIQNLPYIERDHFVAKSTGKYKHMKIGFRICYAASH